MPRYLVSAKSIQSGTFEADSREAAVLLYLQHAGYPTFEAAAEACGQTVERFRQELIVIDEKFLSEPDPRDSHDKERPVG